MPSFHRTIRVYILSMKPSYFLFAKFSCTMPPILPSALKCCPIAPCLSSGPPTFCAVPPMAPSAAETLVSLHVQPKGSIYDLPLNIDPTAPCLSNTLVPVPCVFSPAAGCPKISIRAWQSRTAKTYCLLDRLMKTARHLSLLKSRIGTLLKSLGCIVAVHCDYSLSLRLGIGRERP